MKKRFNAFYLWLYVVKKINIHENKRKNDTKNQNIIQAIDDSVVGLAAIYNYFDGHFNHDNKIDMVEINDSDVKSFDDEARALQDFYLPEAIKEAHNKYVALLTEWRNRKAIELNDLLTRKTL